MVEVKKKKLWDNYTKVAEVEKSDKLKFVVSAATRDGYRYVTVREFYYVARDDAWKPGRDGIAIPIVGAKNKSKKPDPNNPPVIIHPMADMLEILKQANEIASTMAIEDEENAMWIEEKEK